MTYKDNDIVEYDNGIFKGRAKIKGISLVEMPAIGKTYIVEDLDGWLPNSSYEFTYFTLFECHIKEKVEDDYYASRTSYKD